MKHRKKGRKLNRTASHKKALLSNLSISLIKNKRIKTTEAKAKELRTFFEPFVTKAKDAFRFKDTSPEKNVHLRRLANKSIKDKEAIKILFDEIGPKVLNRPGGYTRVLKTGFRAGDGADLAIIELVDFSFIKDKEEPASDKKGKKKIITPDKEKELKPETKKTEKDEVKEDEPIDDKKDVDKKEKKKTTEKVKKTKDDKLQLAKKDKEEKIKKDKSIEDKTIKMKEDKKVIKKEEKNKQTSVEKDTKEKENKTKKTKSAKSDNS
jgi:large subunit ribosomal protein L17